MKKGVWVMSLFMGLLCLSLSARAGEMYLVCDDRKIDEQKIDPDVNLIFKMAPMESQPDLAIIKLTAEKFSNKLETQFKSAAPLKVVFGGTGGLRSPSHEVGRWQIGSLGRRFGLSSFFSFEP